MSDEEPSRPLMAPRKVRVLGRRPTGVRRRRRLTAALWLLLVCSALVVSCKSSDWEHETRRHRLPRDEILSIAYALNDRGRHTTREDQTCDFFAQMKSDLNSVLTENALPTLFVPEKKKVCKEEVVTHDAYDGATKSTKGAAALLLRYQRERRTAQSGICRQLRHHYVWNNTMPMLTTESAFRHLDVNEDGTLDVVFGFGTAAGNRGCGGGVAALDGRSGNELWRLYVAHELFALSCRLDLDADGVWDCIAGGRMAVRKLLVAQVSTTGDPSTVTSRLREGSLLIDRTTESLWQFQHKLLRRHLPDKPTVPGGKVHLLQEGSLPQDVQHGLGPKFAVGKRTGRELLPLVRQVSQRALAEVSDGVAALNLNKRPVPRVFVKRVA
ncbi:hypothetical protein HPB50_027814 [Hyalomma asiaticum]|nr:hypothetical protein HPB50_027814 [Hyalomma asiaticum]